MLLFHVNPEHAGDISIINNPVAFCIGFFQQRLSPHLVFGI